MKKYIILCLLVFPFLGLVISTNTMSNNTSLVNSYHSSNLLSRYTEEPNYNDEEYIIKSLDIKSIIAIEILFCLFFTIGLIIKTKKIKIAIITNILRTAIAILVEVFIDPTMIVISIFSLFVMAFIISLSSSNTDSPGIYDYLKECPDKMLNQFGITDKEELKKNLYKIFVDIQIANMNFDCDTLYRLCSNEQYNLYKSDLETLKINNHKHIMSDFNFYKMLINSVEKKKDELIIKICLIATFKDYVINTNTNEIVKGQTVSLVNNNYRLEFVKKLDVISSCPTCGSQLNDLKDCKCPYCNNIIVDNNNYILSHAEKFWL